MTQLIGDPAVWRALGHPIRKQLRDHLDIHGPSTATGLAKALDLNTGVTSYHLRVLASARLVAEAPELGHGKERWWRVLPLHVVENIDPNPSIEHASAAAERRSRQLNEDVELLTQLPGRRSDAPWAGISRGSVWFTAQDLRDFLDEYQQLLSRYSHGQENRPSGARHLAVRMFTVPADCET